MSASLTPEMSAKVLFDTLSTDRSLYLLMPFKFVRVLLGNSNVYTSLASILSSDEILQLSHLKSYPFELLIGV